MRYENFERVKQLMKQIEDTEERLQDLSYEYVEVNLSNHFNEFMNIQLYEDHECKAIAIEFIENLKAYYQSKQNKLLRELESL